MTESLYNWNELANSAKDGNPIPLGGTVGRIIAHGGHWIDPADQKAAPDASTPSSATEPKEVYITRPLTETEIIRNLAAFYIALPSRDDEIIRKLRQPAMVGHRVLDLAVRRAQLEDATILDAANPSTSLEKENIQAFLHSLRSH